MRPFRCAVFLVLSFSTMLQSCVTAPPTTQSTAPAPSLSLSGAIGAPQYGIALHGCVDFDLERDGGGVFTNVCAYPVLVRWFEPHGYFGNDVVIAGGDKAYVRMTESVAIRPMVRFGVCRANDTIVSSDDTGPWMNTPTEPRCRKPIGQ
jgi:hypothetical protein